MKRKVITFDICNADITEDKWRYKFKEYDSYADTKCGKCDMCNSCYNKLCIFISEQRSNNGK